MDSFVNQLVRMPRLFSHLLFKAGSVWASPQDQPPTATEPPAREQTVSPIIPRLCSVCDEELILLEQLVRESSSISGPIVEIGTLLGVSATHMALWKSPTKRIITVDNFAWNPWGLTSHQHHDLTYQMLYYLIQTNHVELTVMGKDEFFSSYAGEAPSLVFLDAIHTYEKTAADIAWARKVGAAIICGHDYSSQFPGVVQAVDEAGGPRELVGTLWRLP
jgi:hypothetical protein